MTITIPGEPVAKGRPRVANGHAYTPEKTSRWEFMARIYIAHAMAGRESIKDKPITMHLEFVKSCPKSWTAKKRRLAESGQLPATSRPDIDNYIKAVLDACNGLVFDDDSRVTKLSAEKRYCRKGENPHVLIEIC